MNLSLDASGGKALPGAPLPGAPPLRLTPTRSESHAGLSKNIKPEKSSMGNGFAFLSAKSGHDIQTRYFLGF